MKTKTERRGFTLIELLACQPKPWRRQVRAAFTLIELLVVIAILGILMAMMVPAAGLVLRRAKVAQAKGDAGVVVTVMMKYRMEYNRWPEFAANDEAQHLTDNVWVDAMSPDPMDNVIPPSNPKRIMFFEPGAGALDKTTGFFIDPWGNPFQYQVDFDGDGEMGHPSLGGQPFKAQVIAWSAGPDEDYESWEDNATSWE